VQKSVYANVSPVEIRGETQRKNPQGCSIETKSRKARENAVVQCCQMPPCVIRIGLQPISITGVVRRIEQRKHRLGTDAEAGQIQRRLRNIGSQRGIEPVSQQYRQQAPIKPACQCRPLVGKSRRCRSDRRRHRSQRKRMRGH
jgi:hypothetical protein